MSHSLWVMAFSEQQVTQMMEIIMPDDLDDYPSKKIGKRIEIMEQAMKEMKKSVKRTNFGIKWLSDMFEQ